MTFREEVGISFDALGISSQVKLLITNNASCIVQRATAQSKQKIFVIMV
jgi:hypothetical protein